MHEAIVDDFPNAKILQMPQSVHFEHQEAANRSLPRFAAHQHLTVLARDAQSLQILSEAGVRATLCPDASHFLLPSLHEGPGSGILVIARTDKERAHPNDGYDCDWKDWNFAPKDAPEQFRRAIRLASFVLHLGPRPEARLWQPCWTPFAKVSLGRGVRMIRDYDTVVTDRLHGVLISRMLDRRVIAVDNSYGKVFGYLDTWLSEDPLIERAPDLATGVEMASQGRT
jgi:pyruvyl transferase EpsO